MEDWWWIRRLRVTSTGPLLIRRKERFSNVRICALSYYYLNTGKVSSEEEERPGCEKVLEEEKAEIRPVPPRHPVREELCSTLQAAQTRIRSPDEVCFANALHVLVSVMVGRTNVKTIAGKMRSLLARCSAWRRGISYTFAYYIAMLRRGDGGSLSEQRRSLKYFTGVYKETCSCELTVSCWDHPDYVEWLVEFLRQTKDHEAIKTGGFFDGADLSFIETVYWRLRKVKALRSRLQSARCQVLLVHGYPAHLLEGECNDICLNDFEYLMSVVFTLATPTPGSEHARVVFLLIGDGEHGGYWERCCLFALFAKKTLYNLERAEEAGQLDVDRCKVIGEVLRLADDEFLYQSILPRMKITPASKEAYVAGVAAILKEISIEQNASHLKELVESNNAREQLLSHIGEKVTILRSLANEGVTSADVNLVPVEAGQKTERLEAVESNDMLESLTNQTEASRDPEEQLEGNGLECSEEELAE